MSLEISQKRKARADDDKFVIVTRTYPTSYGCHRGREWNEAELICRTEVEVSDESYDTYQQAVKAAREIREGLCEFDDGEWDAEPPWDSADLENYDNDEETIVTVMTKSEYENDREEDRLYLEKENLRVEFQGKVKAGLLAEQSKASGGGKVFYANPYRASDIDIPAELELNDTADLNEIKKKKDLSSIKSLCFQGTKEQWIPSLEYWNCKGKKEDVPPQDLLLDVLPQCTSLQELHLKNNGRGSLSSGYMDKILEVAPHLAETLKVLSFPRIEIDPEGVGSIAKFQSLEHLDMWYCLSCEYYDFGNEFARDPYEEEDLPYDDSLSVCVESLENLTRLDLGYGDDELLRGIYDYALSRIVLDVIGNELEARDGELTLEDSRKPQDFPDEASREAARKRVLLSLSENEVEKPGIREMAKEELKTCS